MPIALVIESAQSDSVAIRKGNVVSLGFIMQVAKHFPTIELLGYLTHTYTNHPTRFTFHVNSSDQLR